MKNIFTQHPESLGESYTEHLKFAFKCGLSMTMAGIACILHAIFPFIFVNTASQTLETLQQEILERKRKAIFTKSIELEK